MKEIRMQVADDLYREYKIYCVENSLSIAKQTSALIQEFLKLMKANQERMGIKK